jgi:hypothetical protein
MKLSIKFCLMVVILFAISTTLYAQAGSNGLILYFSFDKANGDKVPDMSAGKHDGTLKTGAKITTTAKYGGCALEIVTKDSSMEVAAFKEMNEYEDNTFLFWIYFTSASNNNWNQVLAKLGTTDRCPGIWINPDGLGLHYRFDAGNVGVSKGAVGGEGKVFEQKTWYHVAGVRKGAELTFYANKKAEITVPGIPAKVAQGPGILYVGKSAGYAGATFIIDDLAIYNRALTAAEVTAASDNGFTAVAPQDKLSTAWGDIKTR